jgi:hypothetical protein
MSELGRQYIEMYYNEYDDSDRYFDIIYDLYEKVHDSCVPLLNNDSFQAFFDFCMENIDRTILDDYIIKTHILGLSRELGRRITIPRFFHDDNENVNDDNNENVNDNNN